MQREIGGWNWVAFIQQTGIKKPAFWLGFPDLLSCFLRTSDRADTHSLGDLCAVYFTFFAISVAMLGMTIGAVWVYVRVVTGFILDRLESDTVILRVRLYTTTFLVR